MIARTLLRSFVLLGGVLAGSVVPATRLSAQTGDEADRNHFEQKIRPVLVEHCYGCHSVKARDDKKLQGGLYLDSAEGVNAGGESGPVVVKGKSADSLLIKALRHDGLEMPPTGKLPEAVIADFVTWIDRGAFDPRQGEAPAKPKREINLEQGRQWWAFRPLSVVTPPELPPELRAKLPADRQVTQPIDRFIVSAQLQQGLTINTRAAKEKLLRRVTFDVIGLPPTPEDIDAFLKDDSPQAFEKVVDRLLASEHYGEKWARHWLDAARYAESGGYEFDGFRPGAYHYRDWVILALNQDLPYDQFVRQQLAGDKLAPDDYDAAAATGFLVAGPYPGQITAKTVERIRYDQLDDMLMTIGGSMLGLTLGCVRCHEHKYDPIPHPDYYALAASLGRTVHGSRTLDPKPQATLQAQVAHQQELDRRRDVLRQFANQEMPKRFDAWKNAELGKQPESPRWQILEPVQVDAERSWLKWLPNGLVAHDGSMTPGTNVPRRGQMRRVRGEEEYRIVAHTHQKNVAALRLDALTDKSLPQRGPGLNGDGSFQLAELKVTARPLDPAVKDAPVELKLKPVFAAFEDKDQPLANALDGKPATAWVVRTTAKKDNAAVLEIEPPLAGFAGGTELSFELKFRDMGIGRLRLSLSVEPNPATWAGDVAQQNVGEIRAILAAHGNQLPEPQREAMARWFAPFDTDTANAWRAVRDHAAAEPRPALVEVYTTVDGGQDVFLLRRGEVDNKQGKAEPGFLQVLRRGEVAGDAAGTAQAGGSATGGSGAAGSVAAGSGAGGSAAAAPASSPVDPRVALANWMTDVDHGAGPLLARVMVNRIWQHHFGEGIVGTPNDFGVQGKPPTHPELLEWLANELVRGGWKLKPIHKLILLSETYQQSHQVSPENVTRDPENRYLWHYRPSRLDAELIRDALLAVGGNLDTSMYGPSILDNTPRRSVYLRVKRSELLPIMTMFDAPEPTQSIGMRISTTVPTQALALMNSPFVRQQAERLSQRIRSGPDATVDDMVDRAYQIAFARRPTDAERTRMIGFIDQQKSMLGGAAGGGNNGAANNAAPNSAAANNTAADKALTDKALVEFCHVLLCLNEFVYVD